MSVETETWKPVPGFEGCYEISNRGNILSLVGPKGLRRTEPRLLLPHLGRAGYWVVTLQRDYVQKTHFVHCLVAEAFIGPRPEGHHVNHIDGNRHNARLDNLEYVTPGENLRHAYRIGNKRADGEHNGQSRLTRERVLEIIQAVDAGQPQGMVASRFGVRQATVSDIVTGRCWASVTGRAYQRKGRWPQTASLEHGGVSGR